MTMVSVRWLDIANWTVVLFFRSIASARLQLPQSVVSVPRSLGMSGSLSTGACQRRFCEFLCLALSDNANISICARLNPARNTILRSFEAEALEAYPSMMYPYFLLINARRGERSDRCVSTIFLSASSCLANRVGALAPLETSNLRCRRRISGRRAPLANQSLPELSVVLIFSMVDTFRALSVARPPRMDPRTKGR